MSNTIARLYRGQLEPKSVLGTGNSEMRRTEILIGNNYNKLKEKLNDETKIILEKYSQCIDEYIVLISEQAFVTDFVLVQDFQQKLSAAQSGYYKIPF